MRYFAKYNGPNLQNHDNQDIESYDYIFLGNYVGRGMYGLETICTLFSLKLKYREECHLLRGSMEDMNTNRLHGFADECARRLGENVLDPNSVF